MPENSPVLRADGIDHRRTPPGDLAGVSVAIEARRFTLLSGIANSDAGLLLRILGLLERPDSGELWFGGQATAALDDAARLELRNHSFGFVFAEPFLLDSFSVAENVAMPLFKISGLDIEQARTRTAQVLDFVGLSGAADCPIFELTFLDQHKVALARALANAPQVLIAEDAGMQLSRQALGEFAALLRSVPGRLGVSVIATSPLGAGELNPDREIRLEGGGIVSDSNPVPLGTA